MKEQNRRKKKYFYSTLVILTVILFAVTIYYNIRPKWYVYLIVWFVSKGISNFLLHKHYNTELYSNSNGEEILYNNEKEKVDDVLTAENTETEKDT